MMTANIRANEDSEANYVSQWKLKRVPHPGSDKIDNISDLSQSPGENPQSKHRTGTLASYRVDILNLQYWRGWEAGYGCFSYPSSTPAPETRKTENLETTEQGHEPALRQEEAFIWDAVLPTMLQCWSLMHTLI